MPVRPEINLAYRQPDSPLQIYTTLASLLESRDSMKERQQLMRLRALQEQEAALKLQEAQRSSADAAAVRGAYATAARRGRSQTYPVPGMQLGGNTLPGRQGSVSGPGIDRGVLLGEMQSAAPHLVPGMESQFATQDFERQKQMLELQESLAKADSATLKRMGEQMELAGRRLAAVKSAPPDAQPQLFMQALDANIRDGLMRPDDAPQQFDPGILDAMIAESMTAKEQVDAENQRRGQDLTAETARRGQDMSAATARAGQAVTMRGQDLTDSRQREANAIAARTAGLNQEKLANEVDAQNRARQSAAETYRIALDSLDRLEKHPGLSWAVGARVPYGLPGTSRSNFEAELEAFKAQVFLPQVQALRGMGQLSDREGAKLENAVGALSQNMSESAFKESIQRIREDLKRAKARAEGNGGFYRPPQANSDPLGIR